MGGCKAGGTGAGGRLLAYLTMRTLASLSMGIAMVRAQCKRLAFLSAGIMGGACVGVYPASADKLEFRSVLALGAFFLHVDNVHTSSSIPDHSYSR